MKINKPLLDKLFQSKSYLAPDPDSPDPWLQYNEFSWLVEFEEEIIVAYNYAIETLPKFPELQVFYEKLRVFKDSFFEDKVDGESIIRNTQTEYYFLPYIEDINIQRPSNPMSESLKFNHPFLEIQLKFITLLFNKVEAYIKEKEIFFPYSFDEINPQAKLKLLDKVQVTSFYFVLRSLAEEFMVYSPSQVINAFASIFLSPKREELSKESMRKYITDSEPDKATPFSIEKSVNHLKSMIIRLERLKEK